MGELQDLIDNMNVVQSSDNRIVLESDTHKAIISKKIGDVNTDNWLLTAYEKKKGNENSASSSDIETEPVNTSKRNGTATSQEFVSDSKDTKKPENDTIKQEDKSNNGVDRLKDKFKNKIIANGFNATRILPK